MNYYLVNNLENLNPSDWIGDVFVLPNGEIFEAMRTGNDQLGGFSDVLKKIGQVALNVGGGYIGASGIGDALLGGGGSGGQAKGYVGIMAFGNRVMSELEALLNSGAAPNEIANAADKLVAILSDHSKVYQAKNGDDADKLKDFKKDAAAKRDEIKQILSNYADAQQQAAAQQTAAPNSQANQPGQITLTDPKSPLGISGIGWAGIALTAFFLLRR